MAKTLTPEQFEKHRGNLFCKACDHVRLLLKLNWWKGSIAYKCEICDVYLSYKKDGE